MPTRQLLKKSVRWHKTIQFKIILSVALTTMAVNGFFTYVYLDVQAKTLDATILKSASLMSETIKASIQFDMVRNLKEEAYHIMKSIGSQQGIEKVRIYASDGRILFSTHEGEQETMVDKKAEACYGCHAEAAPLEHLTGPSRTRIFPSGKGYRVLGMINPLYNEPNCYTAACHAHPASQKVLGVIDVTMSLAYADAEIRSFRRQIILFNILSIVSISTIAVLALMFVVGNPIRQLVLGTERVAHGDLAHSIPIDSDDEMGFLARSFNHMTENLRKANDEIREWIRTLEQKVEDRTKELKDTQFQLMHAEKLASLGKIAATVAHEINNPLTGVFTYVKLMERKIEQGKGNPPTGEIPGVSLHHAQGGPEDERDRPEPARFHATQGTGQKGGQPEPPRGRIARHRPEQAGPRGHRGEENHETPPGHPGGPLADEAGVHQYHHQRVRSHGPRIRGNPHDPLLVRQDPEKGDGRVRRQRPRDPPRGDAPPVRTVLHHQGEGDGPGPCRRLRDHHKA